MAAMAKSRSSPYGSTPYSFLGGVSFSSRSRLPGPPSSKVRARSRSRSAAPRSLIPPFLSRREPLRRPGERHPFAPAERAHEANQALDLHARRDPQVALPGGERGRGVRRVEEVEPVQLEREERPRPGPGA